MSWASWSDDVGGFWLKLELGDERIEALNSTKVGIAKLSPLAVLHDDEVRYGDVVVGLLDRLVALVALCCEHIGFFGGLLIRNAGVFLPT